MNIKDSEKYHRMSKDFDINPAFPKGEVVGYDYEDILKEVKLNSSVSDFDIAVMNVIFNLWLRNDKKPFGGCQISYKDICLFLARGNNNAIPKDAMSIIDLAVYRLRHTWATVVFHADTSTIGKKLKEHKCRDMTCSGFMLEAAVSYLYRGEEAAEMILLVHSCPIICRYAYATDKPIIRYNSISLIEEGLS